jgi:oxaloacetate decarboxylase beta subunit
VLYLGIVKEYEPMLLVPMGFGLILANSLGGEMGVVPSTDEIKHMPLLEARKNMASRTCCTTP